MASGLDNLMTSAQALEELVISEPSDHKGVGLSLLSSGSTLFALSGGAAFGLFRFGHFIQNTVLDQPNIVAGSLLSLCGAVLAVCTLATNATGYARISHGMASLKQYRGKEEGDKVYLVNGGFSRIKDKSAAEIGGDMIGGAIPVFPVESVDELAQHIETCGSNGYGYVLLNGIEVRTDGVASIPDATGMTALNYSGAGAIHHTPQSHAHGGFTIIGIKVDYNRIPFYHSVLRGKLAGQDLTLAVESRTPDFAVDLAARPDKSHLYLLGQMSSRDGVMYCNLAEFGSAFTK